MAAEREPTRKRTTADNLLRAAAQLLDSGGVEAVSTRAVATAAGVQPPVIYRQFGDKHGLLDALTHHLLQEYAKAKRKVVDASDDPIDRLRATWDLHVEFGLRHPDAYVLAYAAPRPPGELGTAAKMETITLLRGMIAELGDQGRLCMSVDRATHYVFAAGLGVTLTLMQEAPGDRDFQLSETARENSLSTILNRSQKTPTKVTKLSARAVALAEALRRADRLALSAAEQGLLDEWLVRLADHTG